MLPSELTPKSAEDNRVLDVVFFFDECMPRLSDCGKSCETNSRIPCPHRLGANSLVLYSCEDARGLSDYHLVLYFIDLIESGRISNVDLRKTAFILATRDKKFMKSVRRENNGKQMLTIDFKNGRVFKRDSPVSVWLRILPKKHRTPTGCRDLFHIIESLKFFYERISSRR